MAVARTETVTSPEESNSKLTASQAERSSHALVMKGGGIKGLAYVGALKELQKYYEFDWFVGTSAGAITAVLLAAGYTTEELEETLSKTNFRRFFDARFYKLPTNYYFYRGLYPGEEIKNWINELLSKKLLNETRGIRPVLLKDLPKRVTIYASRKDRDVLEFDSETPEAWETPVSHAVLCSMAIPIVYQPPQHHGGDVFDGGLQNNYPVDVFLRSHPDTKFVGLYLKPQKDERTRGRPRMLSQLISIWTEAADIRALKAYINETVVIDPRPIRTLQFGLRDSEKEFLLKVGRAAALTFLGNQDLPNGPTHELAATAIEEAEKARQRVYETRSNRMRRRLTVIFTTVLVLIAAGVAWAIWLRQGENRQHTYSNINVPSTSSPTLVSSPSPEPSPENSPPRSLPSPAKSTSVATTQVDQHIWRARALYADGKYQAALRECNHALRLDANNREARDLKNQIQITMDILNR
jgi:predicted acylesterase/phospholipase RssA